MAFGFSANDCEALTLHKHTLSGQHLRIITHNSLDGLAKSASTITWTQPHPTRNSTFPERFHISSPPRKQLTKCAKDRVKRTGIAFQLLMARISLHGTITW